MIKHVGICVAAFIMTIVAATASAPLAPTQPSGVVLSLAVLSADEAWVNARIYERAAMSLEPKSFAFQLRAEKTGVVYFVGATAGEQRRTSAPDASWKAITQAFAIRLPSVEDGAYELEVRAAVRSGDMASSSAVVESLYVHEASIVPVQSGTKFYRALGWYSTHMPAEFVLKRIDVDANGQLTKYEYSRGPEDLQLGIDDDYPNGGMPPEIDDPFVDRLNEEFAGKQLWTFGRFEYTCYGHPGMGVHVNSDERLPMFIDHFIRVAGDPTQRQYGDAWDPCSSNCGIGSRMVTDNPIIALFSPLQTEIGWIRMGIVPKESPYPGMCTRGTYAFVDDSDIERTFTTEDPHTVYPAWDSRLRASLLAFDLQLGMTHEMVAFVLGYPSIHGTKSQLGRLSTWTWHLGTPCQAKATFEGDRLVKFDGARSCVQMVQVIGASDARPTTSIPYEVRAAR